MKKFLIILLCILVCGCKKSIPQDVVLTLNDTKIEVYKELHLYDLIKESNVTIKDKNKLLDTTKVGKFDVTITFKYKRFNYKKVINYEVVDKTAPVFIKAGTYFKVLKDSEINPCSSLIYADNYDKRAKCEIVGNLNFADVGRYKLKYRLTDSSNNISEKDLVINVVSKIENNNTNNTKPKKNYLYFNDAIKKYKNNNTSIGIDVSAWQGEIDFQKVKDAGVEFVMIRMAVQSGKDKEIVLDKYFEENIIEAKKVGLKVGVYVYTTAINNQVALEQAEWVVSKLKGTHLDFPIAYDWENWNYFMNYNVSLYELSECVNVFANTLKHYGYNTMLYSSKFYLEKLWMNRKNLPVWLAHYTSKTNYKGDYIMWQLSNTGKVDGINGDVDIDVYYKK